MVETTDRTIQDTNRDVPRIIKRGFVDFTTYSTFGSLVKSTTSVTLSGVLASQNPIVECYTYVSSGTQTFSKMNYSLSNSTGDMQYYTNYYLTSVNDNGNDVIKLNFEDVQVDGTVNVNIYYIVYSSSFTKEVVF